MYAHLDSEKSTWKGLTSGAFLEGETILVRAGADSS